MNPAKMEADLAKAVAQGATERGEHAPNLVPSSALHQAAEELEIVALACRRTTKGKTIMGALFRIQDRLELAMAMCGGAAWGQEILDAIGLVAGATSGELAASPGLRLAIRGLVREARRRARRLDAATSNDEAAE